ncbi:MAG: glycine zipper 2TM domain-containing protein [Pseudomonadota bacterium]
MDNAQRLHPLVGAAAVSVIVVSAAGVAAITGYLPRSGASPAGELSATAPAAAATVPAPGGVTAPITSTPAVSPTTRPSAKKNVQRTAQPRAPEPIREFAEEPRPAEPVPAAGPRMTALEQPAARPSGQTAARATCPDCGVVEAVRAIEQPGEGSWIGTVAGGVGGAVLGSQFGKGSGRTIMTVLGAAGGAYAGREIEKRVRTSTRWEVTVRMDDGTTRTASYDTEPAWRAGERVRWSNGALEALPRA